MTVKTRRVYLSIDKLVAAPPGAVRDVCDYLARTRDVGLAELAGWWELWTDDDFPGEGFARFLGA